MKLPWNPCTIITIPFNYGRVLILAKIWSVGCLNTLGLLKLHLLLLQRAWKMNTPFLLLNSWSPNCKIDKPIILIWLWECMPRVFIHYNFFGPMLLPYIGMRLNFIMDWSHNISKQLYENKLKHLHESMFLPLMMEFISLRFFHSIVLFVDKNFSSYLLC
jgi:hypothetical protein